MCPCHFCFVDAYFVTSVKICTMMIEMSSKQSISQLHTVYYIYYIYICIQSAAAGAAMCVAILLLLLQKQCCCFLLLFVIVCRIAKIWCCFIEPHPSVVFLFIQTLFIFDVPLPLAVIAAMRGAKAGVSPPRRSPPCTRN